MSSIDFLMWVKTLETPALTAVFKMLSYAGSDLIYVLVVAWLYWCVDKKVGIKWALLVLSSALLNSYIKLTVRETRPFVKFPGLKPLAVDIATGYSFPSGHSQAASAFGTFIALENRSKILKGLGLALLLAMGLSRLYLRVHWPVDVLGGWLIGAVVAVVFHAFYDRYTTVFLKLLVPIIVLFSFITPDYDHLKLVALFVSTLVGFALNERFNLNVHVMGQGGRRKYAFGIATILFTDKFMKYAMHGAYPLLRYMAVGLVMAFVFPLIFEKIYGKLKRN